MREWIYLDILKNTLVICIKHAILRKSMTTLAHETAGINRNGGGKVLR